MSTPQKTQGGNEGDGLGGLGHSGPLVTISSPSVIVKPLVAAHPPQPPPAYAAAVAPSHQHHQRTNPQTQQDPSRSVQPMYTVVDGDAIALLQYPHPTARLIFMLIFTNKIVQNYQNNYPKKVVMVITPDAVVITNG